MNKDEEYQLALIQYIQALEHRIEKLRKEVDDLMSGRRPKLVPKPVYTDDEMLDEMWKNIIVLAKKNSKDGPGLIETLQVGDQLYWKQQYLRDKHGALVTVTGIQEGNTMVRLQTATGTELKWYPDAVRAKLMRLP